MAEGKNPNNQSSNATPDGGGTEQSSRATPYAGYQPAPGMPPAMAYDYRDDEISLYELWNVLVRRRLTIGAVFLVVTLAAAIFALSRTPTYALTTVLEIGRLPNAVVVETENRSEPESPVESSDGVVARLNEVIIPSVSESLADDGVAAPMPRAEVINTDSGLVRLTASIPQAEFSQAASVMEAISAQVVRLHRDEINRSRNRIQTAIDVLRAEVESLSAQSEGVSDGADGNPRAAAERSVGEGMNRRLMALIDSMNRRLVEQDRDQTIVSLRQQIASLEARRGVHRPTVVAREPALSDQPQGQPASTIIALGAVLGLMLGVFAAFGREFLANAAAQAEAG